MPGAVRRGSRVRVLDADGPDRQIALADLDMRSITPRQLVWADLVAPTTHETEDAAARFGLPPETVAWLTLKDDRPRAALHLRYVRLRAIAVEPSDAGPVSKPLGIVAGWRFVLTVHHEPLELFEQLDAYLATDAMVGQVDAAIFLAAILNTVVTGYFIVMDEFENEVDSIDDELLADSASGDVLGRLVWLRGVATDLRRAITAHRDVFGSLAWADFEAIAETHAGGRFQLVADRFDRAVDAVESARDQLVGAFEIHLARTAQRTNDVMKVLTIVSALLLPGSLLAQVLSMNVATPMPSDDVTWFWIVMAAIAAIAMAVLVIAKRARWF